ncbi:MAG TPA: phospho-N-acetylmuramoyl-pentapeptide-transferase, partial [Balneolaceae bacterium]|nr:phospho-N-acetylmuramoyl-pentapeptide-transferase [Balneolaceae bacterium]
MLYELLHWLEVNYQPPGFSAFEFITTRTAMAAATALFISIMIGRQIIKWLEKMQLREVIREDIGLDTHLGKAHTPTMGGLIILLATLIPALLWMHMDSIYTWM